jgi:signal transduction histidine kinase
VVAVSVIGLAALLVPTAVTAQRQARQRALDNAAGTAHVVEAVLVLSTDLNKVQTAVNAALDEDADRVAIHGLAKAVPAYATDDQLDTVALDHPKVFTVSGGEAYVARVGLAKHEPVVIEVFIPQADLTRGVPAMGWMLFASGMLFLVAVALAADWIATRAVTAAEALAATARKLADGDLQARAPVPARGPRELGEAAAAFNTMADRVEAHLTTERELIADRSHRLRTPLTALRLEAERLRPTGMAYRLAQAVEAMEREVDHVIHTARQSAEMPTVVNDEHCDAAEVVRERMTFWAAVAEDQSRPFRVVGTTTRAPVPVPKAELAAALDALLGNVFRYTAQGTPFEVEVARRDGYVAVRVDDAGPGIARPRSAMRRGSSERGSTGLGLDIVRRAAVAGQGGVNIDRARLGGASVVVLFADAEPARHIPRQRLGFVGRLSREPDERRWRRRAREARSGSHVDTTGSLSALTRGQLFLMSVLSLLDRLSRRLRRG